MRPGTAGAMALLVVSATGCSPKTLPTGGLMLELGTDCTLPRVDSLRVDVRSLDLAKTYLKQIYRVPEDTSLPASLGIRSNGDTLAALSIEVSVWSGGVPLDVRSHRVHAIPTDVVREIAVTFSARCTPFASLTDTGGALSTCEPDKTCDPARTKADCDWSERDAAELPLASHASFPACPDAGSDAIAMDAHDAADPGDGAAGAEADVWEASIDDGGSPDALACRPGTTRCSGGVALERCDMNGAWEATACATFCRSGVCDVVPPSCKGDPSGAGFDCRTSANSTGDCCASDEVPGGTFLRSYDGDESSDASHPATLSAFRLDDYEVTVGRFRQFVRAVVEDGWVPPAFSGKHTHLNGGSGLASGGAGFETGWDVAWNAYLSKTQADWNSDLRCSPDFQTWYPRADANEKHPINCVSWYRAYAFCIWDGGFLPSEAEWNYAAAGGARQWKYPWGDLDPGANAERAVYDCYFGTAPSQNRCSGLQNIAPVGLTSAGRSSWGQWDLAGNLYEWTLDWNGAYIDPCVDCAAVVGSGTRVDRGGGFYDPTASTLRASARHSRYAQTGYPDVGIRCAREP